MLKVSPFVLRTSNSVTCFNWFYLKLIWTKLTNTKLSDFFVIAIFKAGVVIFFLQRSTCQDTASVHSDRIANLENTNPAPRKDLHFSEWVSSPTGDVTISMKRHMVFGSLLYTRIMEEWLNFMNTNGLYKYKIASCTSNTKL